MAETSELYQYDPLPEPKGWIRVLTLLPRTENGLICIALRAVSFDEAEDKYDAISYTWGLPEPLFPVRVQGRGVLWLRENIYRFLTRCHDTNLRNEIRRDLWIDSISINQEADGSEEKAVQVQQMGQVFQRAHQVLIWLGEASENSIWAEVGPEDPEVSEEFLRKMHRSWPTDPGDDASLQVSLTLELRRLVEAPYWSRLWIVQEILLADDVRFISGTKLAALGHFRHFCTFASAYRQKLEPGRSFDVFDMFYTIYSLVDQRSMLKNSPMNMLKKGMATNMFLVDTIDFFATNAKCAKWQDRVFGLLGLVENGDRFNVDYSLDQRTLLSRILEFVSTEEGGSLRLGSLVGAMEALGCTIDDAAWCFRTIDPHLEEKLNLRVVIAAGFGWRNDTPGLNCTSTTIYRFLDERKIRSSRTELYRHTGLPGHVCTRDQHVLPSLFPDPDVLMVMLCFNTNMTEQLAVTLTHDPGNAEPDGLAHSTRTVGADNDMYVEDLPSELFEAGFFAELVDGLDMSEISSGNEHWTTSPPVSPDTILSVLRLWDRFFSKT